MPRRFGRGAIPLALVTILICIFASNWTTYDRVRDVRETDNRVAHTWQVKASVERIYGTVVTAESDIRAYVISLNEPSLRRYRSSKATIQRQIAEVRVLTSDNPNQAPHLDDIERAVAARYAIMDNAAQIRSTRTLAETVALLNAGSLKGKGVRAMDDVRSRIAALDAEEDRLLASRMARSRGQALQAEVSFVFSAIISIVLISAFGALSNRLVSEREEAAEEERGLRGDLEREVERTRAAESQLQATMIELRRSNEELQSFAFVASHDLQEPLRKIRAFSDRVRRRAGDALDDEARDSLQRVEAAADRMQRLILDLLELSRITTKVRPHLTIDPDSVIDEVADDLQTRLEETSGTVVHLDLPTVMVDPAQFRQLFQNLIANALKFRREDVAPEIRIEGALRPDGRVDFAVHDNGIGFESKYADRIFVVFQRLHGRGEYEGSGIGLAIVRKIVERHGGTIAAEGRLGEGATFRFDLPAEAVQTSAEAIMTAAKTE